MIRTLISISLFLYLAGPLFAQSSGDVVTVAGGGEQEEEGIPARDALLVSPFEAIADSAGTLYIADAGSNRIRVVDPLTGLITTLAGTGELGDSGDGGPATAATLRRPQGLALDEDAGILYIADTGNHRVRAVDLTTGIITAVAGNGSQGFAGDSGPALDAEFDEIVDLVFDGQDGLYIADGIKVDGFGNNRVRLLDLATDTLQTIAGTGLRSYSGDNGPATEAGVSPEGLALDTDGLLYIADAVNHRVRRMDPSTGVITTVAGRGGDIFGLGGFSGDGGPATLAQFDSPIGVAVGAGGDIYIADFFNNRIRVVDPTTGTVISTVARLEPVEDADTTYALRTPLVRPIRVNIGPSGELLIASWAEDRIRRMETPQFRAPYALPAVDEIDFGSVTLGDPITQTVAIDNPGSDTLVVDGLTINETTFVLGEGAPITIPPAGSQSFDLTSNPDREGLIEGLLTLSTNDPLSPLIDIPLAARGVVPQIGVFPQSLAFDRVFVGDIQTHIIRISNLGLGTLIIPEPVITDSQFVTDFVDTLRIGSGQNSVLSVTFRPSRADTQQAELRLITNDIDDSPFVITLQGTGQVAKPGGFVDVADSLGTRDEGAGFGVAWGDYDNDGDPDVYVVRSFEPNRLYRNDGGRFTEAAGALGLDDDGDGSGAAWSDIDGDSDLDLYVTNFGGPNRLFRNDGSSFAEVGAQWGVDDAGDGYGTAIADYDDDGDPDIYVANFGPNRFYRNEGTRFVEIADSLGLDDDDSGVQPSWADADNDGDPDLFLSNSGGNRYYLNRGDGTFVDVTAIAGLQDSGPSFGAAWGDYDNDGDLDLYIPYFAEPNRLYRNDRGRFQNIAPTLGVAHPGRGRGAVWGDFDNDGDLDLYVTNSGESNLLYRNDGDIFVEVADSLGVAVSADSRGIALADMDGDGGIDIFVAVQNGPDRLFRNQEANGNWFAVHPVGVQSSFDAIGTRFEIVTSEGRAIRDIGGGASFLSQDALTASFGIGRAESIDTLTVRWPLGIVQRFVGLPINRRIEIEEEIPPPPVRVLLESNAIAVIANGQAEVVLTASILNDESEAVLGTSLPVAFRIEQGTGMFVGPDTVLSFDGVAVARYRASQEPGTIEITASADGLLPGRVTFDLLEPLDSDRLTIRTVAGAGSGFAGDGGPATDALLQLPRAAVIDSTGVVYVADTTNNRIRRVDAVGQIITTLSGNGVSASSGNGGPAAEARVADPRGMTLLPNGDLLFSEQGAHTIRRIIIASDTTATDTVVAFAGRGIPGFGGDGRDAREANLTSPTGLAADRFGNVWVADQFNHRIRRIDTDGIITTVVGTGLPGSSGDGAMGTSAQINRPQAVAVDSLGAIYIADFGNHRIRKVNPQGIITTIAGDGASGFAGDGGPATRARLNQPSGVAVDRRGNLYIADTGNGRIRLVDQQTGLIQTVAGTGTNQPTQEEGPALLTTLDDPSQLYVTPTGTVLIADAGNGRIRDLSVVLDPGTSGTLVGTSRADFDGDGRVQFADFLLFASAFGSRQPFYDLDGNGAVGFSDFLLFVAAFQGGSPSPGAPAASTYRAFPYRM